MDEFFQNAFEDSPCENCGRCCANILMLSDYEIQKIKKYIKKHNITVQNHNSLALKEDANICPFRRNRENDEKNNTYCSIYPVRPSICKSYSCNPKFRETMDYNSVKAINMLFTFGGENQFSVKAPDLTFVNKRIKELQDKIKKGGNKK